ncbi:flagellar hook-basal body complex protein [Oceanibium sediminis]|uniref:flagellar hook-basal body complex protein n=1 Tax=Oceanibium sediminis TaxID=2026339 RepID=UPI000DD47CBC|nr:flagellar hook-basal body complex protein [Oceanibium sediminis]
MDVAGYVTLSRQQGLEREMQAVANNIANLSTAGFRREGLIFAEMVSALRVEGGSAALTDTHVRTTSTAQGVMRATGGTFDLAIEGDGFFTLETPGGIRLTRAGSFTPNAGGELVTPLGHRLLDGGGGPVFVPPDAESIAIAPDGTMTVDGQPQARIGLFTVDAPWQLTRVDGVSFQTDAPLRPVEEARVLQGFLEGSNVNAVAEISRMIEVQRAYEAGQRLLDREDERIRQVLSTVTART